MHETAVVLVKDFICLILLLSDVTTARCFVIMAEKIIPEVTRIE